MSTHQRPSLQRIRDELADLWRKDDSPAQVFSEKLGLLPNPAPPPKPKSEPPTSDAPSMSLLTKSRERLDAAKSELAKAEQQMITTASQAAQDRLSGLMLDLGECRRIVAEIPEQISNDHNSTRRDVLKELEDTKARIKKMIESLKRLEV